MRFLIRGNNPEMRRCVWFLTPLQWKVGIGMIASLCFAYSPKNFFAFSPRSFFLCVSMISLRSFISEFELPPLDVKGG